jgi:hypothetical protein
MLVDFRWPRRGPPRIAANGWPRSNFFSSSAAVGVGVVGIALAVWLARGNQARASEAFRVGQSALFGGDYDCALSLFETLPISAVEWLDDLLWPGGWHHHDTIEGGISQKPPGAGRCEQSRTLSQYGHPALDGTR